MAKMKPRILFYTTLPESNIGQVFTIGHVIEGLEENGWHTGFVRGSDVEPFLIPPDTRLMVIFRSEWSPRLEQLVSHCRERHITLVFCIDDLIFDPELAEEGKLSFFNQLSEEYQKIWKLKADLYKTTLSHCDAAVLTTKPLAVAASRYCRDTYILPNMFSRAMVAIADRAGSFAKPSQQDGKVRIGFAAGTTTHQQNFERIVPALCEILSVFPNTLLTLVGTIKVQNAEPLSPYFSRIETRPKVPIGELFDEYHRFDISLAPLLTENMFDDSKSELRYGFASLVSVPTLASPAIPMKEVIIGGENGFLCYDTGQWVSNLKLLIENPDLRVSVGKSARSTVISGFGPETLKDRCHEIYSLIMEKGERPL